MKKLIPYLAVLILFTGCGTIDKLLLKKSDDVQTLVSEVPRLVVKADGTISTNAGPVSRVEVSPSGDLIEFVTREQKVTNSTYTPRISESTISAARAGASLIPGYGSIIDLALGGLSAGLLWYARKKNEHAGAAAILIEGIEKTAGSDAVKATVQELALKAGKSDLVHGLVQKITAAKDGINFVGSQTSASTGNKVS